MAGKRIGPFGRRIGPFGRSADCRCGAQGRGRRPTGGAPGAPRWRGRSRNDGSSPSAKRGGGRDGERWAWLSTADTTCCGSPRSRRRRGGAAALGRDGEAGRARCRRDRHACRDPGFAEEGSCGCGRVRRLPGRRASPLVRGRDVARQVTLGAGSAAPNTSGEASCTGEREPWRVCGIK